MRVIYIADDGTQFNNKRDCEDYEERQKHPHCMFIEYYNKIGKLITEVDSCIDEHLYDFTWKVVIHNENEFKDFCWLVKYHGWCEMEDITSTGTWVYIDEPFASIKFQKIEDATYDRREPIKYTGRVK